MDVLHGGDDGIRDVANVPLRVAVAANARHFHDFPSIEIDQYAGVVPIGQHDLGTLIGAEGSESLFQEIEGTPVVVRETRVADEGRSVRPCAGLWAWLISVFMRWRMN